MKKLGAASGTNMLSSARLIGNSNFRSIQRLSFFHYALSPKIFGFQPCQIFFHIQDAACSKLVLLPISNLPNKNSGLENVLKPPDFFFLKFFSCSFFQKMTLRYICLSKLNKSGIRIENQPTGLKNFEQSIGAKIETLRFSVLEL